jgi:ABC-type glycerol-3-phosphate transport system substrate-binding protein
VPAEASFGALLYNEGIVDQSRLSLPLPSDMATFEIFTGQVLQTQRAMDNYALTGIALPLAERETFLSTMMELIMGSNSSLYDPITNTSRIATPNMVSLFNHIQRWFQTSILDPSSVENVNDMTGFNKFLNGDTLFVRTWSHRIFQMGSMKWNVAANLYSNLIYSGMGPIPYAVNNGWSFGILKKAEKMTESVSVLKMLTSRDYQKSMLLNAPEPILPTYPDLYQGNHGQSYD